MGKKIKKIGIWGASITQGYNDFEDYGWVNRLRRVINDNTKPFYIYNLGVSGNTSTDILKRFEIESNARKIETALVSIGVNDSAQWFTTKENLVSIDDYKCNLEKIVKIAKDNNIEIIFVSATKANDIALNPCSWFSEIMYSNEQISLYNNVMKDVSTHNDIKFINIFDLLELSDLSDGLHPNKRGHQKIAETIAEFFKNEVLMVK